MEMDPGELGHDGECIGEGTSEDRLSSQASPDTDDIFGDPQVFPRVGDQYQVEIPPLLTEYEHFQLMKNPLEAETTVDQSFIIGLPIPITWVHEQVDSIKHEQLEVLGDPDIRQNINATVESKSRETCTNLINEDSKVKIEFSDLALDNKRESGEFENGEVVVKDTCSRQHAPTLDHLYSNKVLSPLPGSTCCSWSNLEVESFLLGLYIFGKNLIQVKNFVETKEMGDVLSYYYGKFYRSDAYRRWSECRKIRSRKCIIGQRIFTGGRLQELLSRLFSRVSKECQNALLEVSKMLGEGRTSLEDYVSTLKALVGMNALIEAIGIGKGKQDLTGIVDQPIKPTRPEIPIGKECNSLSSGDIIKFLTGDFRLSKNKANDLFWEAVWPRLLATGWHSEEPKNRGYASSKNSLVFLTPGVKKFSKRKLVKGNHYFDSVTDVLNKVALDPGLLEFSGNKEENGWDAELKLDENGPSDSRRLCYLQPRIPDCEPDHGKFMVVDTSLVHGEGPSKVRELRTLPVDIVISPPTSISGDTDSSDEPVDELESANMLLNSRVDSNTSRRKTEDILERGVLIDPSVYLHSYSRQGVSLDAIDTSILPMQHQTSQYGNTRKDKHPSKTPKRQFSRREKPCQSNCLTPSTKRRRLTAFGNAETSHRVNVFSVASQVKEQDPSCLSDLFGASEHTVGMPQEKVSTGSSAKGGSANCSESVRSENGVITASSHEKVARRPLIDLNLPHDLQDFETDEPFTTEVMDSQDDPIMIESSSQFETNKLETSQTLETSNDVQNVEQQPAGRRQSTRNRPLTTKALEALASGFLNTKRMPRGSHENSFSRPSRRARRRDGVKRKLAGVANGVTGVANGVVDRKADEGVYEEGSSDTNIVSSFQIWPEREGSHELQQASPSCHPEILANNAD